MVRTLSEFTECSLVPTTGLVDEAAHGLAIPVTHQRSHHHEVRYRRRRPHLALTHEFGHVPAAQGGRRGQKAGEGRGQAHHHRAPGHAQSPCTP